MPLNLTTGDGDFMPYIKYNAKAGRWFVKGDDGEEFEITNPVLAFDFANIHTGWIVFNEGTGPEKVWDPSLTQMAPKPPGPQKWKRGFQVMVVGDRNSGIGVREFCSTAGAANSAIQYLYAEYEAGAAQNPNKVPVFHCIGVKPINSQHGTNYEPRFEFRQWVDRAKLPGLNAHKAKAPPQRAGNGQPPRGRFEVEDRGGYAVSSMKPAEPPADRDDMDEPIPF